MRTTLADFVENEFLHPTISDLVNSRLGEITGEDKFKVVRVDDKIAALSANAIVLAEPTRTVLSKGGGGESKAFCSKVRRIEAVVVFEDSNERYIVSDVDGTGKNRYAIRFLDTEYPSVNESEFEILPVCQTIPSPGELLKLTCEFKG